MGKAKKPHTAETKEEWEARIEREQKERDENRNLLVAFAGLNSTPVNEALGLEEYEKEANEIQARVDAREAKDEAEKERNKQEQWEKERQEREAKGFYDYRQESRGLPTPADAVKGAKDAKFGADARATAPWDALTRMHEVSAGGSLGGQIPLKTDPYSLDHVLGSDKFAGIALDSVSTYLSSDGKKAVESLKGLGVGQFGKDKDGKEFSKDSLGLFDLFYTAATDPGDILRPLDKVYDQLQTLGGMVTAANGLKPFLTKDGQKIVDALTALDFGKNDPTGTAQLFRDLFHGDPKNPKSTADLLDKFSESLTSGAGLTAILAGAKPFMGKDGQKAVDAIGKLDLGGKDPTGMATLLHEWLHGDPKDPNSSVTPFQDFFDSAMSKEGVTAIMNAAKPFLGKDGGKIIDALQKAGFATDNDVIGLFPALQELYKGDKATVDILSDLLSNLGTEKGLAALLQGLTPFLPKEGAIAAQAMAEMLTKGWKDALGTLTALLPKEAQKPAKAILALLKNDFQGFLMALADAYLPKELQQTLAIFMQMGGFKGVLGLELPKPYDLVGLGDGGKLGAGDAVLVSGCQGGPLAARVKDPVTSSLGPGFLTIPAAPCVMIGNELAAREMDPAVCTLGPDQVLKGEATVLVCGKPAARMGDPMKAGGTILKGFPTVMIGSAPVGPSSTAATSSGADAAASSAATAGSSGGASAGGEGATEGKEGKEGEGADGAGGNGAAKNESKGGATPGDGNSGKGEGEQKPVSDGKQASKSKDPEKKPIDKAKDLKSGVDMAAKSTGAVGELKSPEAVDAAAKAKDNAELLQGQADEAGKKLNDIEGVLKEEPGKLADIDKSLENKYRETGLAIADGDPETKGHLKDLEGLAGDKAKSEKKIADATAALPEAKSSANSLRYEAELATDASKKASGTVELLDTAKGAGQWGKVAGPLVGQALVITEALTADGSDKLSTSERVIVYSAAEAVPELVTFGVVGLVALASAPLSIAVGVGLTVGWGVGNLLNKNAGENYLRDVFTPKRDAFDAYSQGKTQGQN